MNENYTPVKLESDKASSMRSCTTLHVFTSCRPTNYPRELRENRPGHIFYKELSTKLLDSALKDIVNVAPARCLSLCLRPCGIALSSPGAWSYLFGDQRPGETASDIIECLEICVGIQNGELPRRRRPKALQTSILGRLPPECTRK